MKFKKSLFGLLVLPMVLTACSQSEPATTDQESAGKETAEETAAAEMSPAEISEQAMENFLNKLSEGNYTVQSEDYLKTSVYSTDQVWFDYAEDVYKDFAVMSIDNEVFQGYLGDDGISIVEFLGEGTAMSAAESRLPNYWMSDEASEGNIYNLFYNQQDEPLTFVSYEDIVKQSAITFAGYGDSAMRLMEEVYLEMDDVDPSTVHLKAVVNDDLVARIYYDDIDVVIQFGDAQSNAGVEEWMKNPVYPEARKDWDDIDEFILNSVFLPEYGREAVPFPTFASYAMVMDQENFLWDDAVYIRDSHATEKDMQDYIDLLKEEGFTEAEETDEEGNTKTVYRRILREEFKCYSSIDLEYDNGVDLTAEKYYDFPVYDNIDDINSRITELGFTALPSELKYDAISGVDRANERTESWLYFYTYDASLYVDIDFGDADEMKASLDDYTDALLEAGFTPVQGADDEIDHYDSPNGFSNFRYQFSDDDTVTLLYRAEKYISPEEAETLISQAGFPAVSLKEPISCRDLTRFEKVQYGRDMTAYITVSQTFDTVEEADEFLEQYEEKLNAAGFDRENPSVAGTNKAIAIYNEDKGMTVGIDFFEQNGGALVNMEFQAD